MSALGPRRSGRLEAGSGLLVVPLGATEQHGPHLPLHTDTVIACALADGLAAQWPDAVVAPAVPYGSSGEHQDFPGTLSIGRAAIELVLVELARSATETFPRVLFVSAHGGNAGPVARAVRRLRDEGRDVRAWSPAAFWNGDAHAGRTETSLMLALEPSSVARGAAAAGATAPLPELMGALQAGGVAVVSPNGVLGDPAGASAAEGRELLRTAIAALAEAVAAWPSRDGAWL